MMKIATIIAMDKEFLQVKALLNDAKEELLPGMKVARGTIGQNEMILVQCGIGKVNAASATTSVIDRYQPDAVVSTGVAGGAATTLNVQEVVVSTQLAYHDVYCGSEVEYGQLQGLPARFEADQRLLGKATSLNSETKITPGLIVTGDWFVNTREKMREIANHFPEAQAVDMESAAIAHVCYLREVPFISFRIISDIPLKDTNASQYYNFWETMASRSFGVTKAFLESL